MKRDLGENAGSLVQRVVVGWLRVEVMRERGGEIQKC